jgi:hypothetical protein
MAMSLPPNDALSSFAPLIGEWRMSATHPMLPGERFHGTSSFEWLEGGAFVLWRSAIDDARFPAGVAIFGSDNERGEYFMLYFDSRGVSRKYDIAVDGKTIRWSRNAPKLSQRNTWTVAEDGRSFAGKGEMSRDGGAWEGDLEVEFTRV